MNFGELDAACSGGERWQAKFLSASENFRLLLGKFIRLEKWPLKELSSDEAFRELKQNAERLNFNLSLIYSFFAIRFFYSPSAIYWLSTICLFSCLPVLS